MIALLVFLVVVPGTVGDLLNSAAMKKHGEVVDWSFRGLTRLGIDLARDPYILGGLPAGAISFFALMALLSATSVSFAIPMTAASYILDTLLAEFLLKERVDWRRWLGTSLVALGIVFLSL